MSWISIGLARQVALSQRLWGRRWWWWWWRICAQDVDYGVSCGCRVYAATRKLGQSLEQSDERHEKSNLTAAWCVHADESEEEPVCWVRVHQDQPHYCGKRPSYKLVQCFSCCSLITWSVFSQGGLLVLLVSEWVLQLPPTVQRHPFRVGGESVTLLRPYLWVWMC